MIRGLRTYKKEKECIGCGKKTRKAVRIDYCGDMDYGCEECVCVRCGYHKIRMVERKGQWTCPMIDCSNAILVRKWGHFYTKRYDEIIHSTMADLIDRRKTYIEPDIRDNPFNHSMITITADIEGDAWEVDERDDG